MNQPLPGRMPDHTAGQYQPATITRQIGVTDSGGPVWATYTTGPATVPQQPIVARPWGAYLAAGTLAVILLTLFIIGLAILATVLTVCAVALVICLRMLQNMWQEMRSKE